MTWRENTDGQDGCALGNFSLLQYAAERSAWLAGTMASLRALALVRVGLTEETVQAAIDARAQVRSL